MIVFPLNLFGGAMRRVASSLILISLLSACVSTSKKSDDWPKQIPEKAFYLSQYAEDDANKKIQSETEYLKWVKRFYFGWSFYPKGWEWLTATTLKESADYALRLQVKSNMQKLGRLISGEWAKNTNYRRINTAHLMVWGDVLKVAIGRKQQVSMTLTIIDDVKGLLANDIQPSEIEVNRYLVAQRDRVDTATIVLADDLQLEEPF